MSKRKKKIEPFYSFDPGDHVEYYLVSKGARDVAIAESNINTFDEKRRGSFIVSKKIFIYPNYPDTPQYILYVKGRSDQKAEDLVEAMKNRDSRKMGLLLGYAPELVEEFMGFFESTDTK